MGFAKLDTKRGGSIMYVLNYDNHTIKKFTNKELVGFLNTIVKKKFLFANNKFAARKIIKKTIK